MKLFEIFIVHNATLVERKCYLDKAFGSTEALNFIQIEQQQPDFASKNYAGLRVESWNNKVKVLWQPPPEARSLSIGEIACTASHFYAYKVFLEAMDVEWLVVLEDDAIFDPGLPERLNECFADCPSEIEGIFVGGGFHHEAVSLTIGQYKNLLIKHHPATNTTVGYALRRKLVTRILKGFDKFDLPIDYELAYLLMVNNALVAHIQPYLINEGSKFIYSSSLGR